MDDNIRFNCPNCNQPLKAAPDMAGELIECPACSKAISIPHPSSNLPCAPPSLHDTNESETPPLPPPMAAEQRPTTRDDDIAEQHDSSQDFVAGLDEAIDQLICDGILDREPTRKQKREIIKIAHDSRADLLDIEDIVTEHFPALLSQLQREANAELRATIAERERRVLALVKKGKYTIPEKTSNEPPATKKQVDYLRILGVEDDAVLSVIGKSQASKLISQMSGVRKGAYKQVESAESGGKGGGPLTLCAGAIVIVVLAVIVVGVLLQKWLGR